MSVSNSIWVENTATWVLNWKPSKDEQVSLAWDLFSPILDKPQARYVILVRAEISLFCLHCVPVLCFWSLRLQIGLCSVTWCELLCENLVFLLGYSLVYILLNVFLILLAGSTQTTKFQWFMWTMSQTLLVPQRKISPYSCWHWSCKAVLEWPKSNPADGCVWDWLYKSQCFNREVSKAGSSCWRQNWSFKHLGWAMCRCTLLLEWKK